MKKSQKNFEEISGKFSRNFEEISKKSWKNFNQFWRNFEKFFKHFRKSLKALWRNFGVISKVSEKPESTFMKILRLFWRFCEKNLMKIEEIFKTVCWKFQEIFGNVGTSLLDLRMLPENVRNCSVNSIKILGIFLIWSQNKFYLRSRHKFSLKIKKIILVDFCLKFL